ncbi:DUF1365 domain-containing protein [Marinobacter bryozoorum]|uniref:DUF1365 domain-containing protein n=1 Tax=Marinobacter bryozoorum TaxID=256324 RepID=UPI003D06743B
MTNRAPALASSWLTGTVRHRRHSPASHEFAYRTGMLALNLADWSVFDRLGPLVSVERPNVLSLRRRDYLDPHVPDLQQAVCDRVQAATGWRPDGPVELITHPRHFGYVFNPVSFYFCYRQGDDPVTGAVPRVILAQITNTPWHERHVYCLEVGTPQPGSGGWRSVKAGFDKRFHVSPFNPMDQSYQWTFSFRGPELRIHMNVNNAAPQPGKKSRVFDATLVVQRVPLNRKTVNRSLLRFPVESFKVIAGIYWHALRLKLKGVPFHTHPDKLPDDHPGRGLGREDRGREAGHASEAEASPGSVGSTSDSVTRITSWRT